MNRNDFETRDPMWQAVYEAAYLAADDAVYWSDPAKSWCTEAQAKSYSTKAAKAAAATAVSAAQAVVRTVLDKMWGAETASGRSSKRCARADSGR